MPLDVDAVLVKSPLMQLVDMNPWKVIPRFLKDYDRAPTESVFATIDKLMEAQIPPEIKNHIHGLRKGPRTGSPGRPERCPRQLFLSELCATACYTDLTRFLTEYTEKNGGLPEHYAGDYTPAQLAATLAAKFVGVGAYDWRRVQNIAIGCPLEELLSGEPDLYESVELGNEATLAYRREHYGEHVT